MTSSPVSSKDKHIFSSDRPIENLEEDLLGRDKFATRLADVVSKWTEKDTLVMAVYGAWGNGKSSVKNMMLKVLSAKDQGSSVSVLEFNPWQWKDEDSISIAFYREVGKKIGCLDNGSKQAKDAAKKWEKYAAYLELADHFVKKDGEVYKSFLSLAGIIGLVFANDLFNKLILALLAAFNFLKDVSKAVIGVFKSKSDSEETLSELKSSLRIGLQKFSKPVVVVIDDVDRLNKSEVRALFQTIKANADFPNLIYVLFFQRDIVEKSVGEEGVYSGSDYLEKIIQVGFDLPVLSPNNLIKILNGKLDAMLVKQGLLEKLEKGRWYNTFNPGLSHYFKNLRDVNRFVSSLSFHIDLHKDGNSYNVNLVDLISIEVLRLFEPIVYSGIFQNKTIFTSDPSDKYGKEERKKVINDLIGHANNFAAVTAVFKEIFPNTQWAFSNYQSNVTQSHFVERRVCHPEVFDRYFELDIAADELPARVLDEGLALVGNRDKFVEFLNKLKSQGQLSLFLNRFEAYKEKISTDNAISLATALMDISDMFEGGDFFDNDLLHANRIIRWHINQEKDKAKKKDWIIQALKQTIGATLPVDWVFGEMEKEKEKREQYPDLHDFEPSDFDTLKKIGLEVIERAVKSGAIANVMSLDRVLWPWLQWDKDSAIKWVVEYVKTKGGFFRFLDSFSTRAVTTSIGNYYSTVTYKIPYKSLEHFIPIEQLLDIGEAYEKSGLDSDQAALMSALREAKDRKDFPERYKDRWERDE